MTTGGFSSGSPDNRDACSKHKETKACVISARGLNMVTIKLLGVIEIGSERNKPESNENEGKGTTWFGGALRVIASESRSRSLHTLASTIPAYTPHGPGIERETTFLP